MTSTSHFDPAQAGLRLDAVRTVCTPLNQTRFARTLGASLQQYNNWVHGYPVPVAYMAKAVQLYRVTLDWLYLGDASCVPYALKRSLEEAMGPPNPPRPSARISSKIGNETTVLRKPAFQVRC